MAQAAQQDDLSDVIPGGASATSSPASASPNPWLVMQAQKEVASGKPGAATAQLGNVALKSGAIHPTVAAYHAEKAGVLPPGSTQKMASVGGMPASPQPQPSDPTAANPAGVAGNAQGDPNSVLGQIAQKLKGAVIPTQAQAQELPKGTSEQAKSDDSSKSQLQSAQKLPFSPQSIQVTMDANRGIQHPQVGFNKITLPDGRVVDDTNSPIYDMDPSKATYASTGKPVSASDMENPYQAQKNNLQKLQDLVDARRQAGMPTRPADLTGLMMLADTFGNTNRNTAAYSKMRENQEAERQHDIAQGNSNFNDENVLAKDQNDLQKDLISGTNATLQGGTQAQLLQNQQNMMLGAGFNNQIKAGQIQPQNTFMSHYQQLIKPVQADEDEANKVIQLVNSHNPAAISGIKEALTRLMTGARPQMQLISSQAQDPSLGQRMESYMSQATSGQLPVENVAQMNQMVSDLMKVTSARRSMIASQMHGYGDSVGLDRPTQDAMMGGNASPGLTAQAGRQGKNSVGVAQGQVAAHNQAPAQAAAVKQAQGGGTVTMYKNGQAFNVPKNNVKAATTRGYTLTR